MHVSLYHYPHWYLKQSKIILPDSRKSSECIRKKKKPPLSFIEKFVYFRLCKKMTQSATIFVEIMIIAHCSKDPLYVFHVSWSPQNISEKPI